MNRVRHKKHLTYNRPITTLELKFIFIFHAIIKAELNAFFLVLNRTRVTVKVYIQQIFCVVVLMDPELSAIVR